jgi:hypothetical protein
MRRFAICLVYCFVVVCAAIPAFSQGVRDFDSDKVNLLALEHQWLHARDAATLDRILAADFVHPVPAGYFLSKDEHMKWFVKHLPPKRRKTRFDHLRVRVYGDTAIVNGMVIANDQLGTELDRSVFTDVFVYRGQHWQAVNAQENRLEK